MKNLISARNMSLHLLHPSRPVPILLLLTRLVRWAQLVLCVSGLRISVCFCCSPPRHCLYSMKCIRHMLKISVLQSLSYRDTYLGWIGLERMIHRGSDIHSWRFCGAKHVKGLPLTHIQLSGAMTPACGTPKQLYITALNPLTQLHIKSYSPTPPRSQSQNSTPKIPLTTNLPHHHRPPSQHRALQVSHTIYSACASTPTPSTSAGTKPASTPTNRKNARTDSYTRAAPTTWTRERVPF